MNDFEGEFAMKILLPVDGSEASLEAVRHALDLVRDGLRATFVLANVQEPATLYEIVRAHDAEVIEHVSSAAAATALEGARALLLAAGVEFETEIGSGDPGHTLVEIVEGFGCGLVIMGARGVGASDTEGGAGVFELSVAALGSVALSVLEDSAVPVQIVKYSQS